MDFDAVKLTLGLGEAHEVWRAGFNQSARFATSDVGWRWDERSLVAACRLIGLSEEIQQAFVDVLPEFEHQPALKRLLWHCYHIIFSSGDIIPSENVVPMLPETAGPARHMFYAFVFLSGVNVVREKHRARGIPEQITIDTLRDIELWIRDYRRKYGCWGHEQRWWASAYFSGNLYALGRLQFGLGKFYLPFVVYRRRDDGTIVAFPEDGSRCREDGQFDGADGYNDPRAWTARLETSARHIRGHPVTPAGAIAQQPIEIDASDWERVLQRGDAILDVHVPASGPMDHDACSRSFAQAREFFPQHFPEFEYKAFNCSSWLLDPQLRDHLPVDSNIVRFLNRFHLLPAPNANHRQTFERVFGDPNIAIAQAPAQTHLQKAIIAHARAGGRWRSAAGIILK